MILIETKGFSVVVERDDIRKRCSHSVMEIGRVLPDAFQRSCAVHLGCTSRCVPRSSVRLRFTHNIRWIMQTTIRVCELGPAMAGRALCLAIEQLFSTGCCCSVNNGEF